VVPVPLPSSLGTGDHPGCVPDPTGHYGVLGAFGPIPIFGSFRHDDWLIVE
jgi:hypothetical protein